MEDQPLLQQELEEAYRLVEQLLCLHLPQVALQEVELRGQRLVLDDRALSLEFW